MRLRHWILIGLLAAMAAACDESLASLAGPTPNLTPTFASIQREVFSQTDGAGRLACTNCHNPAGSQFAAGLDLTGAGAYDRLVNVSSRTKPGAVLVRPGNPDDSYLVHKLEGRSDIVGQRMPRGTGPFLTDGQMTVIRRWIAQGAAND